MASCGWRRTLGFPLGSRQLEAFVLTSSENVDLPRLRPECVGRALPFEIGATVNTSNVRFLKVVGAVLALGVTTGIGIGASAQSALAADNVWSDAQQLATFPASMFSPMPQVSFDSSGRAIAIWISNTGSQGFLVVTSVSTDGGTTWSSPANVSELDGYAHDAQVSMDSNGRAVAVWDRFAAGDTKVQGSWSADGGLTWSTPVDLSASTATNPQVRFDSTGTVIATWPNDMGRIVSRSSADGGATWSAPTDLSLAGGSAFGVQMSGDTQGKTIATWSRYDGAQNVAQSSTTSDGGLTWSEPVNISAAGGDANNPQIRVDSSGRTFMVWNFYQSGVNTVQVSTSTNSGTSWSDPLDLSPSGVDCQESHVGVDSAGRAIVIWSNFRDGGRVTQSASSSDGGTTWSQPLDISAPAGISFNPQISTDPNGRSLVVWSFSAAGTTYVIQSTSSTDGGKTWSDPVDLSSADGTANTPNVALDAVGNAIAIWSGYESTDGSYFIQVSNYSFPLISHNTLPNTGLDSTTASVAATLGMALFVIGAVVMFLARRNGRFSPV